MDGDLCQLLFLKYFLDTPFGHALSGVRVDGAAPRGFLRGLSLTALWTEGCGGALRAQIKKRDAAGAAGCVEGLHRFAQGATAPAALRVADYRSAAMLIKSALRDLLSVSYGMISILRIGSLRSPPPFRLRRTFSTGKRVTRFSGRFAPLRIVFPCHPIRGTE